MLVKLGAHIAFLETVIPSKKELPWFVQNDKSAMQRVAGIEPVMLNPEKFLYMRTRMVSAVEAHGPNANGDAFEDAELAARYATFINSAVNVDHDNDSPDKAVGFILDARYIPESKYVEGIHAIDRVLAEEKRPGIVRAIEAGVVTDTSMGCYVEKSICSECLKEAGWDGKDFSNLNKFAALLSVGRGIATVPEEYCRHIGKYGEKKGGANGPYEINRGVTFFEDSIITTAGADKDAKYLEKLAKLGIDWKKFIIDRKRGGSEMDKVAASGLKMDTDVEKPDYDGTPADKDKALADQAKGKSSSTPEKGNNIQTMEEKGDYVLASKRNLEAVALVRRLAKDNPDAIKNLVFDEQSIGGKPAAVKEGEDGQDEAKTDAATERKPAAAGPDPEAAPVADKGVVASVVASVLKALGIAGTGNPTETAKEGTEQMPPKSGDPDKALATQAKGTSEKTQMKGNPDQTAADPSDHPLTAGRRRTFAQALQARRIKADSEGAKLDNMVSDLKQGHSFEDAKKNTDEKFQTASRIAWRKKIAEDLARGSMGSPEVPDNIKNEQDDSKKKPFEKAEGAGCSASARPGKVAMDRPNETSEERQNEGTKEIKETAPMRTDASRRLKADNDKPFTAKPEDPKKTVKDLDEKSDAMEAIGNAKKVRASVLAKAGYSASAKRNLMDIRHIEASIGKFERVAGDIENIQASLAASKDEATKAALMARLSALVVEAKKLMAEEEKAVENMEKADGADEEKVEAAQKHIKTEAALRQANAEKTETKNRLVAVLKAKAVKELIDLGRVKGIVNTANLQNKVSELSAMSDTEFEATRKVWASLTPTTARGAYIPKTLREAAQVPTGMGVAVTASASNEGEGDLNAGNMFS